MKFVIAGNFEEFKYYFPKPDKNIRYVKPHNRGIVHGHKDWELERVGSWGTLPLEFINWIDYMYITSKRGN